MTALPADFQAPHQGVPQAVAQEAPQDLHQKGFNASRRAFYAIQAALTIGVTSLEALQEPQTPLQDAKRHVDEAQAALAVAKFKLDASEAKVKHITLLMESAARGVHKLDQLLTEAANAVDDDPTNEQLNALLSAAITDLDQATLNLGEGRVSLGVELAYFEVAKSEAESAFYDLKIATLLQEMCIRDHVQADVRATLERQYQHLEVAHGEQRTFWNANLAVPPAVPANVPAPVPVTEHVPAAAHANVPAPVPVAVAEHMPADVLLPADVPVPVAVPAAVPVHAAVPAVAPAAVPAVAPAAVPAVAPAAVPLVQNVHGTFVFIC